MERLLDPRSDVVFKRIFGEHPEILRSFLNAILPFERPEEEIESLEYLTPEQVPSLPLFKNTIVDVRCQDRLGRQFIVEMQMNWTNAFLQRVLFNASKAYVRQLERGDEYELLKPVIGLSILNDQFPGGGEDYYHHYRLVKAGDAEEIIRDLQLVFVELPKYHESRPSEARLLRWAWLRFLREAGETGKAGYPTTEELVNEIAVSGEVRHAIEIARESAFTPGELESYDRFWDAVRRERTLISGSRREGIEEGIEIGEQRGIEIGEQRGIERGLDLALRRLVASGMSEAEARRLLGHAGS
jgi:predicted transposase/invertase (TIGR01784 family)